MAEKIKPPLNCRGQGDHLCFYFSGEIAGEPIFRQAEADRFAGSQRIIVQFSPPQPKRLVARILVQKTSHLIDAVQDPVSAQQISQCVQRGEAKVVYRVKRWETEVLQMARHTSRPEVLQTSWSKASVALIPQAKMKLDRRRHFRIESISVPFPACVAYHRGQMILGKIFKSQQRLIAETQQSVPGADDRLGARIDIDIGLHPQTWIFNISGKLSEALDD